MDAAPEQLAGRAEQAGNTIALPFSTRMRLGEFVKQTAEQTGKDHLAVFAGNLAYRTLFALFPSLVSIIWLLRLFGAASLINNLVQLATVALPKAAGSAVTEQLTNVSQAQTGGTVTAGALIALVVALAASSAACRAAMAAMNAVYEVEEGRSFVRQQVTSLLLALAVAALLAGALVLIVFGAAIATRLGEVHGSGAVLRWMWLVGAWPVIAAEVLAAFALVYYVAPDVEQQFRWISAGSLIAAVLWLLFAAVFSLYVNNFVAPAQTYGALAGIAVLMVYLFGSSFILLLGAEMNQVIEAHHPAGKNPGERTSHDETAGSRG